MAADPKRNSIGAGTRVATPKLGSQGPGELDAALSKAIGARIKITLASNASLEGTLFTACPVTNLIALNVSSPSTSTADGPSSTTTITMPSTYHVFPVSRIQSFRVLSLAGTTSFAGAQPPIAQIDTRALEAREAAAIRKIKERDASRGKGVTKEAQAIYDALARQLPAYWHETSMVINDTVIVKAPYRPEDCSAPKESTKSLERVKTVLENVRRKIGAKGGTTPAAGTGGVRKGG